MLEWLHKVLVWYIGEHMVSIINTNNGIKEFTFGYQIIIHVKYILIFGEHVKVRESLYIIRVIIWINTTPNHFHTRSVWSRHEGFGMVYRPKWH